MPALFKYSSISFMLSIAAILVVLDYASSVYGLQKGIPEANILILWIAKYVGNIWAIGICKMIDTGVLIAFYAISRTASRKLNEWLVRCLGLVTAVYTVTVIGNVYAIYSRIL